MKAGLLEALERLEEKAATLPEEVVKRRERQLRTIEKAEEAKRRWDAGLDRPKPRPPKRKRTREEDWAIQAYGA